jgi:hypothetical protein
VPNRLFLEKSIYKLGTENFLEQLNFPVFGIISENGFTLEQMQQELSILLETDKYVSVYYNLKNEKLFLVIEYLVSFPNRREARNKVICKVFELVNGKLRFQE